MLQSRAIRFGAFELDVRSGELRKLGIRVRLPEQSVQLLLLLLERPGEVVLREDIRLRLWPNDTVVDYDHNINSVVKRLRTALGESAEKLRYIETVARRGYRFTGEVERISRPDITPDAGSSAQYRLIEKVGEGGMGVVYRAEDHRLQRQVAVKLLSSSDGRLPEIMRRRFEQEARAASALNHPNICTVFGLEDFAGRPAIVMEFLEGETLAVRLVHGPLPVAETLRLARQIASALGEAHSRGVVHRDLKPTNIMLTRNGVKVLDFGLATMESALATPAESGTADRGPLVGTLQYLSPEQAQGRDADARSDIFAFGLVLYEMLSGRRAFDGKNAAAIIAAILERAPAKPGDVPASVWNITERCLAKDPHERWQSARDLELELESAADHLAQTAVAPPPATRVAKTAWTIAGSAAAVAIAAAVYLLARPVPAPHIVSIARITNDGRDKFAAATLFSSFPLATDGSRVYFTEASESGSIIAQAAAAGGDTAPLFVSDPSLFWAVEDISPDWSELLLSARAPARPFLEILPVPAGAERRVGDLEAQVGAWSADGQQITYAKTNEIYVCDRNGKNSRKLVSASGEVIWPRWSPDGSILRFTVLDSRADTEALWEVRRDGSGLSRLFTGWNNPPAECCGDWTPDGGYFVFQSRRNGGTQLWARAEEHGIRRRRSDPIPLTSGAMNYFSPMVSRDGNRIFAIGAIARGELARYDPETRQFESYLPDISAEYLSFSRDGRWVAYVNYPEGTLWRSRVDGGERKQLTFPPLRAMISNWSPDGKQIAFAALFPGKTWRIYVISPDGTEPKPLTSDEMGDIDPGWSPDGKSLLYGNLFARSGRGQRAIHMIDLETLRDSTIPGSEALESPRWSPDGRFIAAMRSGPPNVIELYDFSTGKWTHLADSPCDFPSWSHDGRFLYFDAGAALVRLRVSDGAMEQVASLKGLRRANGYFGAWSGLGPGDAPLILRDIGTQEIYALNWVTP